MHTKCGRQRELRQTPAAHLAVPLCSITVCSGVKKVRLDPKITAMHVHATFAASFDQNLPPGWVEFPAWKVLCKAQCTQSAFVYSLKTQMHLYPCVAFLTWRRLSCSSVTRHQILTHRNVLHGKKLLRTGDPKTRQRPEQETNGGLINGNGDDYRRKFSMTCD